MASEPYVTEAMRHLGGEYLELDRARGVLAMAFVPRAEFANSRGNVHGGFLAAMLDIALGSTVNAMVSDEEPRGATLNLNVSYLRPLPLGRVLADARITKRGRSVVFIEGELRGEGEDAAAATATMTLHIPTRPHA